MKFCGLNGGVLLRNLSRLKRRSFTFHLEICNVAIIYGIRKETYHLN